MSGGERVAEHDHCMLVEKARSAFIAVSEIVDRMPVFAKPASPCDIAGPANGFRVKPVHQDLDHEAQDGQTGNCETNFDAQIAS
jgi:hypothetical protein